MGEESIAQKSLTRREGTVEDGRKRKRRAGGKEGLICAQESRQSGLEKKNKKKSPKGETRRSKRVNGEKVKALLNLSDISEKKTQGKSTKQAVSCPGKTGYSAVKEKASERLCVHQLIM